MADSKYKVIKSKLYNYMKSIEKNGLNILNFGNISYFDRKNNNIVIKPSGVEFKNLKEEDFIIYNSKKREPFHSSFKRPSVDLNIHLELYKNFKDVKFISHTHCTAWAQAGRSIPCLGTTHADFFKGDIPLIDKNTINENKKDYELHLGKNIVKHFKSNKINYTNISAALLEYHGVFCWDNDIDKLTKKTIAIEFIANISFKTEMLSSKRKLPKHYLNMHFNRKNGKKAYYGQ